MTNSKISKTLDIILEVGWLAIFGLSPIFFCPWVYGTWAVSEYFLFQVLTEIILLVWLLKIILTGQHFNIITFKKLCSKIKFIFPAVIFIVVLAISTIFSQSSYHSFWGYYYRKMGYLIWLHCFAFFLVLFFNLRNKKQIARIFYVILATTAVVTIYGLMQILGFDIFPWSEAAFFSHRIFSTLGQPNFLASWLLLAIPIIVWGILRVAPLRRGATLVRYLIICLFLFAIFSLVLTQSRGGWLGAFFAFFFFSIIFAYLQKQRRLAALLLILLSIILIFIGYLNFNPLIPQAGEPSLMIRLKTLTQLNAAGKLRLFWWKNSLDLIKQNPVLGYGLETQRFNFIHYYQPEVAALEAINSYPDRAHNDILDTLLVSGFLGLISYLFLIGSAFWRGLKYIFRRINNQLLITNNQLSILCLLAALVGYLISLHFSFSVVPTTVYFWGYLAIIMKSNSFGG